MLGLRTLPPSERAVDASEVLRVGKRPLPFLTIVTGVGRPKDALLRILPGVDDTWPIELGMRTWGPVPLPKSCSEMATGVAMPDVASIGLLLVLLTLTMFGRARMTVVAGMGFAAASSR